MKCELKLEKQIYVTVDRIVIKKNSSVSLLKQLNAGGSDLQYGDVEVHGAAKFKREI